MAKKSIAEIRKAEIIGAFLKVVAKKSFAKATVREIANAAGCSHGMVRHYFGDKESMISAALEYMITAYKKDFQTGVSKHNSALDRLKYLMSWWVDLRKLDIDWGWTMMEFRTLAKSDPIISETIKHYYGLAIDAVTDIIREGTKTREFRKVDPAHAANLISSTLEGIIRLWYVDPERVELKPMAEQAVELFEGYLARHK